MTDVADVPVAERPPKAPIEFRAAQTVDVRFPERVVEVLAMPYDYVTDKVLGRDGRPINEVCERGAFDGARRRRDVRAYRDHPPAGRVAGRAIALHTDRPEGLVAEVRMAATPLGDETLELAADRLLDVSIGFAPMAGGEHWRGRERRLTRCYLDHIAFVGDPAYDTAGVIDVRASAVAPADVLVTPNKDQVRALLFELRYDPDR